MKKNNFRWVAVLLAFCFVISLAFNCDVKANADALTATMIGGAAIAIMQSSGLSIHGINDASSSVVSSWIERKVNSYLGGDSIVGKFGSEVMRVSAGKLILPAILYNNICDFISWLKSDEQIPDNQSSRVFISGQWNGIPVQKAYLGYDTSGGHSVLQFNLYAVDESVNGYYCNNVGTNSNPILVFYSPENVQLARISWNWSTSNDPIAYWCLSRRNDSDNVQFTAVEHATKTNKYFERAASIGAATNNKGVAYNIANTYVAPENADVGYQWEGDIGAAPDTNLEDLLGDIFNNAAVDNLQVDGEIVEPAPAPTPVPTFEPYPPVDDILPGINTGIEIGNDLIVGQMTQTGAITQGIEGVHEAVENLEGTIESISGTPTTEELPNFKFDLRELFPFCIPFDIYRLLQSFDAEPSAPHVQLPFYIESLHFRYNMDLDFSVFNPVAQVLRTCELILYALGLAWATGKVIKW